MHDPITPRESSLAETNSIAPSSGWIMLASALMALGLVMVASATASLDRPLLGDGVWATPFGRQVIVTSAISVS